MNELSFHAHPNADTDQLETGYSWPNAGVPNLARIKQAVWDAFFGTAQPTFEEAGMPRGPVRTLKMRLNEVGWQVAIPPASRGAYFGRESVVTTDEGTQAAIYGNLIPLMACDPAVKSVLFFNLVDDANLDRWQAGLMRADWTRRPSYSIVKGAIAARQTRCAGRPVACRHAYRPVGFAWASSEAPGPLRAEHRLELRRRLRGGHALLGRHLPVKRPGQVSPAVRARIVRSLRSSPRRRRRSAVERQARRRLGSGDPVSREAAEARFLRLRSLDVAELNPHRKATYVGRAFSVRSAALSGRAETKVLTRTRVRSSMANTCSDASS